MKRLIAALALALSTVALSASWWFCDNNGTSRGQATPAPGDLATMTIDGEGACLAILSTIDTSALLGDLNGGIITARFTLTGSSAFASCFAGGIPDVGLVIISNDDPFKLAHSQHRRHEFEYWWHGPSRVTLISAHTVEVEISAIVTPSGWINPNGKLATAYPAQFATAAANTLQIGVSFGEKTGGNSFFAETGSKTSSGTATFHLLAFTIE